MAEAELPITGYLDRFSHRPGETFIAHVSLREPAPTGRAWFASSAPIPIRPVPACASRTCRISSTSPSTDGGSRSSSAPTASSSPVRCEIPHRLHLDVLVVRGVRSRPPLLAEEAGEPASAVDRPVRRTAPRSRCGRTLVEVATGTPMQSALVSPLARCGPAAGARRARTAAAGSRLSGLGRRAAAGLALPSGGACCLPPSTPRRRELTSPASSRIPRSCAASSNPGPMPGDTGQLGAELLAGWDFSQGIDSRLSSISARRHAMAGW